MKNPASERHWISKRVRIVALIPKKSTNRQKWTETRQKKIKTNINKQIWTEADRNRHKQTETEEADKNRQK